VLNNPLVAGLKSDISRGDARLQELSTRLGDAHPQVQEAKANLNELRARLDAETRKVTGSVGMNNTINRQRESEIRRSLEAQRAKVLKLKAVRDEGLVIIRDVENAQRAYDAIQARFTQTNLEGQATQSNVNVLTLASPPLEHSTPKVGLNTILAFFVGSLLAIGTALALELRDRRVRSAEDLVNALKLPVIGLMPKPGMRMPLGARKDSDMQHRLLAPLPQPAKGA
jgi:polysaccharide biosynthesis transport protein